MSLLILEAIAIKLPIADRYWNVSEVTDGYSTNILKISEMMQ